MHSPVLLRFHGRSRGFSLIELMITVAIVAILASIAYPAYTGQIAKGKRAECRSGIMQSMQQQERYFSQFNTYVTVAQNATTAPVKFFSGDTQGASACTLMATNCATTGRTQITQCVEIRGIFQQANASIDYISLDSDNNKTCSISGTRLSSSTTNSTCWP
jgi:type IV pilus assembly protein PilE